MKYLGVFLTQHVQDFYAEKYEALIKEIKTDTN